MQTFENWVIENHPELQEGFKDWAGKMALGGALTAGALGLFGKGSQTNQPQTTYAPNVQQQVGDSEDSSFGTKPIYVNNDSDEVNISLDRMRNATAKLIIGDVGKGTVQFKQVRAFDPASNQENNRTYAERYAKRAILKAAGSNGSIVGFNMSDPVQAQGGYVVANFSWETIE